MKATMKIPAAAETSTMNTNSSAHSANLPAMESIPETAAHESCAQSAEMEETLHCGPHPRRRRPLPSIVGGNALLVFISTPLLKTVSAEDGSFTGQWNGEWRASSNNDDMYDDDRADGANRVYSMWKDDDYYEPQMSTDTFILYATIAILSTLTILFCLCHPEIPVLICMKMTECCCGPFKSRRRGGSNGSNAIPSGEYVGGIQMEKRQDGNSEREVI